MKKIKNLVLITALLVFTMLTMTGCKPTTESLLQKMAANMQKAKSYSMNMFMDIEMAGEAMGTKIDIGMNLDMDMDVTTDPVAIHGQGKVKVEMLGENQDMKMEIYQEQKDDKLINYMTQDGESWVKTETDAQESNTGALGLDEFKKFYENFKIEEKTVTVNDEVCYVLKGEVSVETLQEIMDSAMSGMGESKELFEAMELDDQKLPIELSISKKTSNPVKLSMDMAELMTAALDEEVPGMECSKGELVISFSSFDKIDEIEIPKKVKENAEDTGSAFSDVLESKEESDDAADIFAENKKTNEDEKAAGGSTEGEDSAVNVSEGALKGAEQAGELGNEWNSFNVSLNGKVVTLPCTYGELKASGFELMTEYTNHSEDYIINSGDQEHVTFGDPESKYSSISIQLQNTSEQPIKIKDSLVVGITVSDYSLEESDKKIIFPANVEVGQDINAVIEAYGKPSSKTESGDDITCSWDVEGSYGKSLYISSKDGKIKYIALQNQED